MIIARNDVPKYNSKGRVVELESIRGMYALIVVFYHIRMLNIYSYTSPFISNGYLLLDLFYVLSGFVICKYYGDRINSGKDLVNFQFLRFARLYPIHLIFLLFFLSFEIIKYIVSAKYNILTSGSAPFSDNSITALIKQLLLVHAIGSPKEIISFNNPSWTISVEFYVYILFGLIVLYLKKFKTLAFIIFTCLTLILMIRNPYPAFHELFRCMTGFFVGCITEKLCEVIKIQFHSHFFIISFLALNAFIEFKPDNPGFDWIIYIICSALILSVVLTQGNFLKKIMNSKVLIWLGAVSYSVYMCHYAVIWTFSQILRYVLKRPEVIINGRRYSQLSIPETVMAYILVYTVVFIMSHILYKKVETPIRERAHQYVAAKKKSRA